MQESDTKQVVKKIDVKVSRAYTVFVGENLKDFVGEQLKGKRIYVVTDSNVYKFYKGFLEDLSDEIYVFESGEESKNYVTLLKIYDFLIEKGADRYSYIVGVGGGVVGDIAGYAASSYMRGIGLYHVPTSLLAMVDSSIGGKTGINYHSLKNIVGSFYQPNDVFVDVDFLKTLPDREYISAFAEVVKYGIIMDVELFEFLEKNIDALRKRDLKALKIVVEKSVKNKVEVVEGDEKERGQRAILNFGHTFAHALESITNYERYLHGEAVSIGMVKAMKISKKMGLIREDDVKRVEALLKILGLPVDVNVEIDTSKFLEIMLRDKKNKDSSLRFVLTKGIGNSIIAGGVKENLILEVIGEDS